MKVLLQIGNAKKSETYREISWPLGAPVPAAGDTITWSSPFGEAKVVARTFTVPDVSVEPPELVVVSLHCEPLSGRAVGLDQGSTTSR